MSLFKTIMSIATVVPPIVFAKPQIKTAEIDGQTYICRPYANEPTTCPVRTDLGLVATMALNGMFQFNCLTALKSMRKVFKDDVAKCLVQPPLQGYADNLSLMLVSASCKGEFVEKCAEVMACPRPDDTCGNLGDLLRFLKQNGLDGIFNAQDGIDTCRGAI